VLDLLNNVDFLLTRTKNTNIENSRDPDLVQDLVQKLLSTAKQLVETAQALAGATTPQTAAFQRDSFETGSESIIARRFQEPHVNPSINRRFFDTFYKIRRVRDRIFQEPDMFAEPAWDMLLDLMVADRDHRSVSVTSACVASCVPLTTALRWVSVLEAKGLIERTRDDDDARRSYLMVTDKARALMRKFGAELMLRQLI